MKIDFDAFCRFIEHKCKTYADEYPENNKNIIIETPAEGICFLLTKKEVFQFHDMLEKASVEMKAQEMIRLFNP